MLITDSQKVNPINRIFQLVRLHSSLKYKMATKWIVVGISGTTCGGKTTVASKLHSSLKSSKLISQDTYFLPPDSPKHTFIPELNHINWELLSSLDMKKMEEDALACLGDNLAVCSKASSEKPASFINLSQLVTMLERRELRVLIIEGFSIFNYKPIEKLCHLKYYITLSHDTCWERRKVRVYDPPDPPGYFNLIVWPTYIQLRDEVFEKCKNVIIIDEELTIDHIFAQVIEDIHGLSQNNF